MLKLKFAGLASLIVGGALVAASFVSADTTSLAVTCAGSVSNNLITWTATTTGGNAPYTLAWAGNSGVAGGTNTPIVASYSANGTYVANIQATDASSTVATSTCSGTVTSIVTTPTSTPPVPPLPRVHPSSLTINPNGEFLGRGMTVTSVGAGSFQAQVWGITYTVNWSGNFFPEFLLRYGNLTTSTIGGQLAVGDEVGVSGKVSTSSPLVVNANVVRDYSIAIIRVSHDNGQGKDSGKGDGEDNSKGEGNGKNNNSSNSGNSDAQSRLNELLKQLQNLQNLFHSHGGN